MKEMNETFNERYIGINLSVKFRKNFELAPPPNMEPENVLT